VSGEADRRRKIIALIVGSALICLGWIAIAYAQEQPPQWSPERETLDNLEKTIPETPEGRFHSLAALARAAYDAGEMSKAENYADELLASAPRYRKDWAYGDAIFTANTVAGLVAISRDHNLARADGYLLDSARNNPGSPTLWSFGPSMRLAKELLDAGERNIVVDFLGACGGFWRNGKDKLAGWKRAIEAGERPNFGPNLRY